MLCSNPPDLRLQGRVTVGHACALALAAPELRAQIIAAVAEARVAIVSLPMCNMYLQARSRSAASCACAVV